MTAVSPELGPGERAERAKRRRLWLSIGLLFVAGLVTGFLLGFAESDEGLLRGTIPPMLAIALTILFLAALAIGTPLMLRNMDEVERAEHFGFAAWGGSAFVIAYPAWFLLWKGRLVPEPHHLALFAIFYAGAVLGYAVRRYRHSR